MSMYGTFKQMIALFRLLKHSMGKFAITSWLRSSGTHQSGLSFDLAPRFGAGWVKKLRRLNPNYNKDDQFVGKILSLAKSIKSTAPDIKVLAIEPDHLHVSFLPLKGHEDLFVVLTKDVNDEIEIKMML